QEVEEPEEVAEEVSEVPVSSTADESLVSETIINRPIFLAIGSEQKKDTTDVSVAPVKTEEATAGVIVAEQSSVDDNISEEVDNEADNEADNEEEDEADDEAEDEEENKPNRSEDIHQAVREVFVPFIVDPSAINPKPLVSTTSHTPAEEDQDATTSHTPAEVGQDTATHTTAEDDQKTLTQAGEEVGQDTAILPAGEEVGQDTTTSHTPAEGLDAITSHTPAGASQVTPPPADQIIPPPEEEEGDAPVHFWSNRVMIIAGVIVVIIIISFSIFLLQLVKTKGFMTN
ncbi:hypothetical protein NEPAR04_2213, partial [Nematocida parisii]